MIMHKAETLAQLRIKLAEAEAVDAEALAKHREYNAYQLIKRREWLKAANKAARTNKGLAAVCDSFPSMQGCPMSYAAKVQAQIDMLELIADETFKTTVNGNLATVLRREFQTQRVC